MDRDLRGFLRLYLVVVAIFLAVGVVLAGLLRMPLLSLLAELYLFVGIAYVGASTLAWSGVANLYRYSPTLFVGSRSYRQQIVRGKMWEEGRDDRAFLLGLGFGGAIMGLGAALYDLRFALVDVLGVALTLLVLRARRSRAGAKS